MRWRRWLIVAAIPLLMIVGMAILQQSAKRPLPKEAPSQVGPSDPSLSAPAPKKDPILARQLNVPGVRNPVFHDPADVEIAASDLVIGLIVAGQPRAYLRQALSGLPKKHIVSDPTGEGQVILTHCDLSDCTRVFVASPERGAQEIRVGGLLEDGTLELLYDGRRYHQPDGKLPLPELPFAETSWGDWLAKHPDTTIYIGGQKG